MREKTFEVITATLVYVMPIGVSVDEIKKDMDVAGLRPATVEELMQFGLRYPDLLTTVPNIRSLDKTLNAGQVTLGCEALGYLWVDVFKHKTSEGWYLAVPKDGLVSSTEDSQKEKDGLFGKSSKP